MAPQRVEREELIDSRDVSAADFESWQRRDHLPSLLPGTSARLVVAADPLPLLIDAPGDVPRTEVFFADTTDSIGPFGAKSMSESPYNPINAAMGNALFDATGIRFCSTPFKPDRIFRAIADKFGTAV